MSQWGNLDQANNAPNIRIHTPSSANGQALYGNTTVNATGMPVAVGVFGVDATETRITPRGYGMGWNKVVRFTGPVESYIINAGGNNYSNSDSISVSGGLVNATANVVTSNTGTIISIVPSNEGRGFLNQASGTLAITTSTGTGANVAFVLGGGAGRIQYETLVATRILNDGADDATFPDS